MGSSFHKLGSWGKGTNEIADGSYREQSGVQKLSKQLVGERSALFGQWSNSRSSANEKTLCQEEGSAEQAGTKSREALQGQGRTKRYPNWDLHDHFVNESKSVRQSKDFHVI